ncbi:MAG: ABC transporter permease [Bacteroidota bacterium]
MKKISASDKQGIIASLVKTFKYRFLVYTFAARDLKAQYAQTVLGIMWSIIRPLTGLLIYTVFFRYLLNVDTGSVPYPLFAFSGMICWYYFSYLISSAGTSLLEAQDIIKKIYFPKLILPVSKVLVGLVEFGISLILLFVMLIIWGFTPDLKILLFPFLIALNIITAFSIGIWLSALTVRFRDFHHIIPYLVNFGIFLTPVFYPATLIPSKYYFFIYLNPMAGVIEGFRWVLFGGAVPSVYFLVGFIPVILLFISGLYYFTRIEGRMTDII